MADIKYVVSTSIVPGYDIEVPIAFVTATVKNIASAESDLKAAAAPTIQTATLDEGHIFAIIGANLFGSTLFGGNTVAYGTLVRARKT